MFSKYINKKLVKCQKYINLYSKQPVITNINNIHDRIVAIGDIHGDIDLMLNTLLISRIIKKTIKSNNSIKLNNKGVKEYYEWIGGKTVVVQVGDQIDRCRPTYYNSCKSNSTTYQDEASDIEILLFFTNLNELAKKYGGAVYSLLGNHELMNCYGDIRYVSYKNLKQVQTSKHNLEKGRIEIFKRGDILSTFLGCTRTSILIVNNYLFVHGGVLGSFINKLNDDCNKYAIFEIINDVIKNWLMYDNNNLNFVLNNKYGTNNLYKDFFKSNNINKFIFDIDSPFYTRKLGNIKADTSITDPSCKEVQLLIQHFGLKGIIVGHTPQIPYGINGTCDNKLYRIDIASSKAFYYIIDNLLYPEVLEIGKDVKVLKSVKL
jgi:hypothetical protein